MAYLGQPLTQGQRIVYRFVATQGQSIFSGTDVGGNVLSYVPGQSTIVFFNGHRLSAPDFFATDGTSINFFSGLSAGDELTVVADTSFSISNVYTQTQADARYARTNISLPSLNDSRSLAILTSKLRGSVSQMVGGVADGFKGQDGIDIVNSVGAFVDTVSGALNGGVGGQTFVIENAPSLPKMTSNTVTATGATGYVALASSEANTSFQAWQVFDGNLTAQGWTSVAGTLPQWVQLKSPSAIRLAGYAIDNWSAATNNPTAWTFAGSNDPTFASSTVLDTQTGQPGTASSRVVYQIPAANQGNFLYHRLTVTALNGGAAQSIVISELELLQYTTAFESHPSLPAMTSNTTTATGATGHIAFASSEFDGTHQAWNAFDGLTSTVAGVWSSTPASGGVGSFVGRQTPLSLKVGGYAIVGFFDGSNSYYPNAWRFQGSNDANAATNPGGALWVTLDQRTGQILSGGARGMYSIPTVNQGSYTAHRLILDGVTGGGNGNIPTLDILQVLTGIEGQTSIPYHTGANTVVGGASGYAVSSSAIYGTGAEAYRAADGNRPTSAQGATGYTSGYAWVSSASTGTWIRQFLGGVKTLAYRMASLTSSASPLSWQLQGSNTNNGTDWVTVDSRTVGSNFWSTNWGDWQYFSVQAPGSYIYYRFNITSSPDYARLGEVEFLQGTSGNMDLRSITNTAVVAPTKASLYLRLKSNAGSVTLNTNLTASSSRDGSTWTPMFLTQTGVRGGYFDLEANQTDISGQPVGTNMKYRVQTTDGILGVSIDGADFRWN